MHFCAGACECVHMCAHGSTAICVRVCMWVCMFHVHACHKGWKGRICQLQQFPLSLKFTPHTFHTLSGHENTCPQWARGVEGKESRRAYSCDGESSLFLWRCDLSCLQKTVQLWAYVCDLFDHMLTRVPIKMTELHCHIMFDHMYTKYPIKLQTHVDLIKR